MSTVCSMDAARPSNVEGEILWSTTATRRKLSLVHEVGHVGFKDYYLGQAGHSPSPQFGDHVVRPLFLPVEVGETGSDNRRQTRAVKTRRPGEEISRFRRRWLVWLAQPHSARSVTLPVVRSFTSSSSATIPTTPPPSTSLTSRSHPTNPTFSTPSRPTNHIPSVPSSTQTCPDPGPRVLQANRPAIPETPTHHTLSFQAWPVDRRSRRSSSTWIPSSISTRAPLSRRP